MAFTFLDRLFGRSEPSARETAKDRLRLVLMHDRADIPGPMMEQIRAELLQVLSKYVEIDQSALEVKLEKSEGTVALGAMIPIRRVRPADQAASEPASAEA
ncbi:MAG: cell division topological specificity factor MinE [bacterium]|nr:cell division topological specificity factor MinE [bacterium]